MVLPSLSVPAAELVSPCETKTPYRQGLGLQREATLAAACQSHFSVQHSK